MTALREFARALGGDISGAQVLFPGPGHSARDRSCTLRLSPSAPDGFVVFGHAGDDWRVVRDHVRRRIGLGDRTPRQSARKPLRLDDNAERIRRAGVIWRESENPVGTPVETYLLRRGVALPDAPASVLRWHPRCPFAGSYTGAMIALVRDIVTGEPRAVHRTALDPHGNKVSVNRKDRLAYAPTARGAVKLVSDEDVTVCLGIGEGIETVLSLRSIPEFSRSPAWSLLSAGNLATFPLLSGIETLWIAVDNDPAGRAAAEKVSDTWTRAGREVCLVTPKKERADINDVVRHG